MKKIYAWTMAELTIALIVLMMLATFAVTSFKPNSQKTKIAAYAAIKNLTSANAAVMEKSQEYEGCEAYDDLCALDVMTRKCQQSGCTKGSACACNGTNDNYCLHVTDVLSLQNVNCKYIEDKKSYSASITLPGGAQISGLGAPWVKPYDNADYVVKNVLLDINGLDKNPNVNGADRFPLTIYNGGAYTGLVLPSFCLTKIKEEELNAEITDKAISQYCGTGTNLIDGAKSIILYDVFRSDPINEDAARAEGMTDDEYDEEIIAETKLIASSVPLKQADCSAYGGLGMFTKGQCGSYAVLDACKTIKMCDEAMYSSDTGCKTTAASKNPLDSDCYIQIHKPHAGTTFLLDSIVSQFD